MKQQIYEYKVEFYGGGGSITLDQIKGQKLIMAITGDTEGQKFIVIKGEARNISSISAVRKVKKKTAIVDDNGYKEIPEVRELTKEEKRVQKEFNKITKGQAQTNNLLE